MVVSQIPQIALGYLMPSVIIPQFGVDACFGILAAAGVASLLCAFAIGDRADGPADLVHGPMKLTAPLWIFIVAVFVQNFCMGSVWGYVEQLAHQRHFPPEWVGVAIGGALGAMGVGALSAALLADRLTPIKVLILSGLVQATCTIWLLQAMTPLAFICALCTLSLFWTSVVPFAVGVYVELDATRRVAMLNTPINLVGQGVGPLVVSFFVAEGNVVNVYWISAVFFTLAAVLFIGVLISAGRAVQPSGKREMPQRDPRVAID